MNGRTLQDRLYLGLGTSARHIGSSTDAFRPRSQFDPLNHVNRFLRLPAAFVSASGGDRRANGYGSALWQGVFDASYTKSGDYLVQEAGVFFVASQVPLLPVLCVMTNRTISISRPNMQTLAAGNSYGGYTSGGSTVLMRDWPASVQASNRSGGSSDNLPTDQSVPYLDILIPASHGVILTPGDLITDDLNRSAVVLSSELTNLGWRMSAKMATA